MISIIKAKEKDGQLLTEIGIQSYLESHGNSAKPLIIEQYLQKNYTVEIFEEELSHPHNIYHIIYYGTQPAGYSKIVFDSPHADVEMKNITKLERLYLLKEFYGLKLGLVLFNMNLKLSKNNNQAGMWLFVWKENHRAINFYKKMGFNIIGSYDFKITETHSNPNHHMYMKY